MQFDVWIGMRFFKEVRYGSVDCATAKQCKLSVERILTEVRNTEITFEKKKIKFTFSGGISVSNEVSSVTELIKQADSALYFAKNNGRNQIIIYDELMMTKDSDIT